jgi:hypothetical protein
MDDPAKSDPTPGASHPVDDEAERKAALRALTRGGFRETRQLGGGLVAFIGFAAVVGVYIGLFALTDAPFALVGRIFGRAGFLGALALGGACAMALFKWVAPKDD